LLPINVKVVKPKWRNAVWWCHLFRQCRQSNPFYCQLQSEKNPLVFVQDVTGFMVGSKSEQGGIIKDGAKMVNAVIL
jgi:hypothetical protein